jgi:GGDEF domain-containing protein
MKSSSQVKYRTITQRREEAFHDINYGVYREEDFIQILAFEQKRSERSGKPFLLMTLTVYGINTIESGNALLKEAAAALSVFSRDTDIKGWFRYPSTFGVIFMETDDMDLDLLRENIYRRILAQLSRVPVDNIDVSFYTYPEDRGSLIPVSPETFTFYPDHLE